MHLSKATVLEREGVRKLKLRISFTAGHTHRQVFYFYSITFQLKDPRQLFRDHLITGPGGHRKSPTSHIATLHCHAKPSPVLCECSFQARTFVSADGVSRVAVANQKYTNFTLQNVYNSPETDNNWRWTTTFGFVATLTTAFNSVLSCVGSVLLTVYFADAAAAAAEEHRLIMLCAFDSVII